MIISLLPRRSSKAPEEQPPIVSHVIVQVLHPISLGKLVPLVSSSELKFGVEHSVGHVLIKKA